LDEDKLCGTGSDKNGRVRQRSETLWFLRSCDHCYKYRPLPLVHPRDAQVKAQLNKKGAKNAKTPPISFKRWMRRQDKSKHYQTQARNHKGTPANIAKTGALDHS
jgi:hypothetical protein